MLCTRILVRGVRSRVLSQLRTVPSRTLVKLPPYYRLPNELAKRTTLLQIGKCTFRTTPRLQNPIGYTIARLVGKVAAILFGRAFRKWYQKQPEEKKKAFRAWLIRHKWRFLTPIALMIASAIGYYFSRIEKTPITGRKRFIAFTKDQLKKINQLELQQLLHMYNSKLLTNEHPLTKRVGMVAKRLLDANKDIEMIKDHEWTVSVIDDDEAINAFVLPSRNIFVFTGLLKVCDNDDQLAIVLSHEISHAILYHSIEMMSHAHIVDLFYIGLIGVLWMFLPTDSIAALSTALSKFILKATVETPYSKQLETEADEVGLQLAAKSCFDVREAYAFWKKMSIYEKQKNQVMTGGLETPVQIELLATHPSHEARCENLDKLIEDAIDYRKHCDCPPLPKLDPRERVKSLEKQQVFVNPLDEKILKVNV